MKKILILTLILSALASIGFAEDWYWVCSTNQESVYIDNDNVMKYGDNAVVHIKYVMPSGVQEVQTIHVTRDGYLYILDSAIYRPDGSLIGTTKCPPTADYYHIKILPNSNGEALYKLIY